MNSILGKHFLPNGHMIDIQVVSDTGDIQVFSLGRLLFCFTRSDWEQITPERLRDMAVREEAWTNLQRIAFLGIAHILQKNEIDCSEEKKKRHLYVIFRCQRCNSERIVIPIQAGFVFVSQISCCGENPSIAEIMNRLKDKRLLRTEDEGTCEIWCGWKRRNEIDSEDWCSPCGRKHGQGALFGIICVPLRAYLKVILQ